MAKANLQELKYQPKTITQRWEIVDFITNRPHMPDSVDSDIFPVDSPTQWFIRLLPRGNAAQISKFSVFLMLKTVGSGQSSILADFTLKFVDDHSQKLTGVECVNGTVGATDSIGFRIPTYARFLLPVSQTDKLIIDIEITMWLPVRINHNRVPLEIPKSSMNEDLMKLLQSGDHADFIVESADGQEFPVHKAILSARNAQFFATMFTSGMKEAGDKRVKLPFEGEIVSALLEYLYTDEVVNLTSSASQLYSVAHEYQLNRLMAICAENICQNLTVANVFMSLRIAKLYEDVKLQSACEKYIDGHQSDSVQMVSAAAFNDDLNRPKAIGKAARFYETSH